MPGKPWKVLLISKDGGSPESLTSEDALETDPTWSNDGAALAFGHVDLVHLERTFIELFNLKTRQLSPLPDSQGLFGPRWSRDGRYIVALTEAANGDLRLYEVKAQKWHPLSLPLNSFGYIAWSEDSAPYPSESLRLLNLCACARWSCLAALDRADCEVEPNHVLATYVPMNTLRL
jgi:hypothetical protein